MLVIAKLRREVKSGFVHGLVFLQVAFRRPCVRVCVCPLTFSNDFSSEAAGPILLRLP